MSHEYLSDEELQKLIFDIELSDTVEAPANIQKEVLKAIDSAACTDDNAEKRNQKIIEYRLFRLKVALASAAAVVSMLMAPRGPVIDRAFYAREDLGLMRNSVSKEEVLKRMHVKTKEEILNEKSLHESLMQKKDDIETKLFNIFNDGLEVDDEI